MREFGELLSQSLLVLCNLPFDFRFLFLSALQILPIPLQKIVDCFDAELNSVCRPVLVQVLEGEIRRARALHDLLDHAVNGRVVTINGLPCMLGTGSKSG